MKHRSVIAFVLVAAALFAAPQISHDLQAFKGALGARLRGELLHAILNLPSSDGAVAPNTRRADALLASCPLQKKSDAPSAKTNKSESRSNVAPRADAHADEARVDESQQEQLAAVAASSHASSGWTAERSRDSQDAIAVEAAEAFSQLQSEGKEASEGEVAMIIPPGMGLDPPGLADLRALESVRGNASRKGRAATELKRVRFIATRFDGKNIDWQKADDEALRKFNEAPSGTYEFRLDSDGATRRVLKVRRTGNAARPPSAVAPRASQAPGLVARFAPVTAANALPASE
jgi:hypothetical protein